MNPRIALCRSAAFALFAAMLLAGCGSDKPEALVASAKEYIAKNDRNAAVIQLKNALHKNPDLAEGRFLLGKTLLELGDQAAAEKELTKADELRYPFDQVAPILARAILARGDYKKVLGDYSRAEVKSAASKADLQTTLGDAFRLTGNLDAARDAFAAALAAVPDYPPALIGQARMTLLRGDAPEALALAEKALAQAPKLTDGLIFKGDVERALGHDDNALAAYRKAIETRPHDLPAHARTVSMLFQQGKDAEAGTQIEAMKKVAPKHPETLYLQALLAYRKRDYVAAREVIQQQLRVSPDNVPGLLLDASIEFQLRSFGQAEASLQKVLARAPSLKFARVLLVNTYLKSGQPVRALDALRPLLEAGDEDSDIMSLAGEVYMQNGDTGQATRYFAKAAQLDPKSADKRAALAVSHMALGDTEVGFRELQEAAASGAGTRADLALIAAATYERKFDVALTGIDALERKQPGWPLASNLRGAVLVAKGDLPAARKSFERAQELAPADFTAAINLAKLDLADKKPDDAQRRFETLLAKDPKNARAILAIADLRAQSGGTPDEVVAMIGKAVAAEPTSTAPRLALISYYMRAKEPKRAVAAAQDALAAMPDQPELLYAAGQAQQAAGEPNQAAKTYNKLAQARPGSPLPFMKEAESQIGAKDYDGALTNLKKALALKPDLLEAERALISVYLATGRLPDALAVAREVQKQRPREAVGYLYEGDIYVSKKAWKDAAVAFRRGLGPAGTSELAAKTYASLRAGSGDAEAEKFASAWLKDHPKDLEFRGFLGEADISRGDFASAARRYKALIELSPDNALVLNNLAWVSGQLKDPRAIEYAERANKLVPDNPAILDTLGVLLVDIGETKRGIESLQRASTLAPDASGIRLNLARALIKDGQKDAARKVLDVLVKLGDKFSAQAEVTKLMQGL